MSKSLGNVLDPFEVIERFGADALRFYLLRDVRFGQDGSVSTAAFELRYEASSPTSYGNLASRTIAHARAATATASCPTWRLDAALARGLRRACPSSVVRAARRGGADGSRSRRSGSACAGSTATSRSRRRGCSPRTPAGPDELDRVLASLAEGLRVVDRAAVALHAGRDRERLLDARSARPAARGAGVCLAALGAVARVARSRRFSRRAPGAAGVIDSHTHLDACEPPDGELVAAAQAAGRDADADGRHRRRICRAALAAAERFPAGVRGGRPPPERRAAASTTPTWRELRRSRPTSAASRSARRASTTTATARRASDQQRAFAAQIELARELGKPLVIHTRAADEETLAALAATARAGSAVIMHCFSMPEHLDECLERAAGGSPSPATSPTRAPPSSPRPPRCVPDGAPAGRDRRARTWRRRPSAASPTSRRSSRIRLAFVAELRGVEPSELERNARAQRRRACSAGEHAGEPRPPSLRRMRPVRRAARPRSRAELPRRLQHPWRDRARRRALAPGRRARDRRRPGRAVRVPRRARGPRARGRDRRAACEPALRDAIEPFANVTRASGPTRWRSILPHWTRRPNKRDREPALRDRRGRDPADGRGARLADPLGGDGPAARSASGSRRGPAAAPTARRACSASSPARSRSCARSPALSSIPVPNVDSVLIGMTRAPGARAGAAALVQGAFAHRRKALRELARAEHRHRRERCAPLGRDGTAARRRAERLAPASSSRALWEAVR